MINLTHTVQEVELIVGALRKLPMEVCEELVNKIKAQAIPQLQALQPQPDTEPAEHVVTEQQS